MSKVLLLICLTIVWFQPSFSQEETNKKLENLIEQIIHFEDPNPTTKPQTDSLSLVFNEIFIQRNKEKSSKEKSETKLKIFELLDKHSTSNYDDSIDQRRHNWRRAICFACLALTSDINKAETFLGYSRFSLSFGLTDDNFELIKESVLGILLLEVLIKYEADNLDNFDVKKVTDYVHNQSYEAEFKAYIKNILNLLVAI